MGLAGQSLIGATSVAGSPGAFRAVDPATAAPLDPEFGEAGAAEVERACALAWTAFDTYREAGLEERARLLESIAAGIIELGDRLIERAVAETGLPRGRIEGERGRTVGQLRLFAELVRDGAWMDLRIDPAQPVRTPLPRSDLRLRNIPLGPVAVFGAGNFPLAFSVAGGDTASALAAGCPVVVKAHPAHPGTSELVGRAVQAAVAECRLPEGVFSVLFGIGNRLGEALVTDPRVKAVGFTGSRGGGLALMRLTAARPEPIPVEGPDLDAFVQAAQEALTASSAATMLTPGIFNAYQNGVARLMADPQVTALGCGQPGSGPNSGQPTLFAVDADNFLANAALREEIFGAASLLVRCPSLAVMRALLEQMEGQLTVTLQMDDADRDAARFLLPVIERKAGRILVNGWPTGVEVSHACYLRPVCYQDFPDALLPAALRDDNPMQVPRLLDGKRDAPDQAGTPHV